MPERWRVIKEVGRKTFTIVEGRADGIHLFSRGYRDEAVAHPPRDGLNARLAAETSEAGDA